MIVNLSKATTLTLLQNIQELRSSQPITLLSIKLKLLKTFLLLLIPCKLAQVYALTATGGSQELGAI